VFQNRLLRRIFGRKRGDVEIDWRKLHNEELHNLYNSPGLSRMIKPRRMRETRHIARIERREMHVGYWWESQKERDY
jgi:hypothetical protein